MNPKYQKVLSDIEKAEKKKPILRLHCPADA